MFHRFLNTLLYQTCVIFINFFPKFVSNLYFSSEKLHDGEAVKKWDKGMGVGFEKCQIMARGI